MQHSFFRGNALPLVLIAVVAIVVIGVVAVLMRPTMEEPSPSDMMPRTQEIVEYQEPSELTGEVPAPLQQGSYETYAPEKIARAADGDVVLFFHAPWCPYCRGLDADINAHVSDIPDGLTILKTDYDSEVALKQAYGVTYQHTMVQVDANGTLIHKWSGSSTLSALVSEVQ